MADATTISGLPYPEGSDANNVPSDMADLATALDGTIVKKLTAVEIAALAAGEKPAGTVVYNTTTGKLQVSNGSTFANVTADSLPLAGGTATGNVMTTETLTTKKAGDYGPRVNITDADGDGATLTLVGGKLVTRVTTSGSGVGSTPVTVAVADGAATYEAVNYGQLTAAVAHFTGGETDVASGGTFIDLPTPPSGTTWALTASGSGASGGIGIKVGKTSATRFTVYCLDASGSGVAGHVWYTAVAY